MVLWKFSLRELLNRPVRATLTLLSIVIGVGIIVSASIATQTTQVAYRDMFKAVSGAADLEVVAVGGGLFDKQVLSTVAETPGIASAVPAIRQMTMLFPPEEGKARLLVLGVDPAIDDTVRQVKIVAGKPLGEGEGLLLEDGLARSLKIHVGDEVKFMGFPKPTATVTGLISSPLRMASTALMPIDQVDALFKTNGRINGIQVVLAEGADEQQVRNDLAARLPEGLTVQRPGTRTPVAEETMRSAELGLQLTSGFSLLLATFIILNTFLMNVGERRRQLAIMRAVGATRRQIVWLMYRESIAMAAVGVTLGLLAGFGGGHLLIVALDKALLASLPPAHVSWTTLLLAAALGFGISIVGAALPAYRAGNLTPLEGMRPILDADTEGVSHTATLAGVVITVISLALLAACIVGWLPVDIAVAMAIFLLIGVVLLVPTMLGGLSAAVVWGLRPLIRVEADLAKRQILRHRGRSTLTVGVLFVASATGVGMACTILDNIRDVKNWYEQVIVGDFLVRAMMPDMATGMAADLPPELCKEIHALPDIEKIGSARFVSGNAADQSVVIIVRDFTPDQGLHLNLSEGDPDTIRSELAEGQVVIGTVLAQQTGLKVGDTIPVKTRTDEKTKPMRIAALTNDYLAGGLVLYMQRDWAKRLLAVEGVDALVIKAKPDKVKEVRAVLDAMGERYGVMVESPAELKAVIDGMVSGVDACLWGILALGFIVAAFGTVNTLAMNVLEQTRELGLLRVVAMTRGQVRRTILCQAVILASLGLVPGTLAGVAVAYLINLATMTYIGHPVAFQWHPVLMASSLVISFIIVLLAAGVPAERAARLELEQTLQYE